MKTGILLTVMMLMIAVTGYSADENLKTSPVAPAKLYVVYLSFVQAGQTVTYVLEAVEAADFHGIKCIRGRFADLSWMKGKVCYVPLDKVSAIVEYNSLEQYKEDIQKFSQKQLQ